MFETHVVISQVVGVHDYNIVNIVLWLLLAYLDPNVEKDMIQIR
jgi:hypothetical protein